MVRVFAYAEQVKVVLKKDPSENCTFGYAVFGSLYDEDDMKVVIDRTVPTPRLTLAGTDDRLNQKLVKEVITMAVAGT